MRPDFCIIGAMKCGTTTLAYQLGAQEGVFITDPKEPNFFSDDNQYAKGINWYTSLFSTAPRGAFLGEASTHYTKFPTYPVAAERFLDHAPDAKLIYMVREPVSRALSHLRHAWTQRELVDGLEESARNLDILWQYGCYHQQLAPWLARVPQEKILVVALERLNANPHGEFDRVLQFLGLQGAWAEDADDQNQGADRTRRLPFHDLVVDSAIATSLRRALVPKWVRTKVRESRQLKAFNISSEAKAMIADRVRDDLLEFGALFDISDLSPETFAEKVRAQQLNFA